MKILKRILLGLGALIVGLILLLVGAFALDGWLNRNTVTELSNTIIPNLSGPEVRAYVARPATPGPHPAVIMIHEFWGLRADLIGKADALAQEGYLVVVPDVFRGSSASWIPRAIYQVAFISPEQVVIDLDAVFVWLEAQPEVMADRIGIMGFCFGGGVSLRYSLSNTRIASTVILYGPLITDPAQLRALPGPVLGLFGGSDQSIPVTRVMEFEKTLNEIGVPNKIVIFEGEPHAFVGSIEEIRQGGAPGQAWDEVIQFFNTTLQDATPAAQASPAQRLIAAAPDWDYWLMLAYEHTLGMRGHAEH